MVPKTPFNNWVLSKIASYLSSKEGMEVDNLQYTNDGAKLMCQDAFGYRYEVSVKTISRISNDSEGLDKYAKTSQNNFLVISEAKK